MRTIKNFVEMKTMLLVTESSEKVTDKAKNRYIQNFMKFELSYDTFIHSKTFSHLRE